MSSELKEKVQRATGNGIYFTFTIVVDILVIMSFCTAVTDESLKSVVVLFAITYLSSFFEQRRNYYEKEKVIETFISDAGCIVSILLLAACMMIGIGFFRVNIQEDKVPKLLLMCGENAIFAWGSVDITYLLFGILFYPLIFHIAIGVVGILKARGIRILVLLKSIVSQWVRILECSLVGCALGIVICWLKYYLLNIANNYENRMGAPQYQKYALGMGLAGFGIGVFWSAIKNIKEQKSVI